MHGKQLPEELRGLERFTPYGEPESAGGSYPVAVMESEPDGAWFRVEDVAAALSDQEGKLREAVKTEIKRLRDEGRDEPTQVGGKIVNLLNPTGRELNAVADRLAAALASTPDPFTQDDVDRLGGIAGELEHLPREVRRHFDQDGRDARYLRILQEQIAALVAKPEGVDGA